MILKACILYTLLPGFSSNKFKVTAVAFLPTGRHLVSGGEDGVVACYRIPQAGMTSPGNIEQEGENNMSLFIYLFALVV